MQMLVQVLAQDVRIIQIMFGPEKRCGKELLAVPSICEVHVSHQSVTLP